MTDHAQSLPLSEQFEVQHHAKTVALAGCALLTTFPLSKAFHAHRFEPFSPSMTITGRRSLPRSVAHSAGRRMLLDPFAMAHGAGHFGEKCESEIIQNEFQNVVGNEVDHEGAARKHSNKAIEQEGHSSVLDEVAHLTAAALISGQNVKSQVLWDGVEVDDIELCRTVLVPASGRLVEQREIGVGRLHHTIDTEHVEARRPLEYMRRSETDATTKAVDFPVLRRGRVRVPRLH